VNKPIRYSDHLISRLNLRQIDQNLPKIIIRGAEQRFEDTVTGYFISIKRLEYCSKIRPMMVVYEDMGDEIVAVTIHPLEEKDIQAKVKAGRWK